MPRLNRTDEFMVVPVGLLDDALPVRPERSIYWNERADWLVSVDDIPKFLEGLDSAISIKTLRRSDAIPEPGLDTSSS